MKQWRKLCERNKQRKKLFSYVFHPHLSLRAQLIIWFSAQYSLDIHTSLSPSAWHTRFWDSTRRDWVDLLWTAGHRRTQSSPTSRCASLSYVSKKPESIRREESWEVVAMIPIDTSNMHEKGATRRQRYLSVCSTDLGALLQTSGRIDLLIETIRKDLAASQLIIDTDKRIGSSHDVVTIYTRNFISLRLLATVFSPLCQPNMISELTLTYSKHTKTSPA